MSDPPEKLTLGYLLNRESEQARRGQIQRRRRPSTSSSSNTSSPEVIGSSSGGHTRRPVPASSAQPSSSRQSHGRPSSAQSSSGLPVSSGQSSSHPSNLPTPPTQGLASSSGEGAGPSSSQRSFQCELCNRNFVERGNLNKHISSVHLKEKSKVCPEPGCGKSFSFRDGLMRHISHVHQNQRRYACHLCDKTFKQASHLGKHMRSIHKEQ